VGVVMLVLWVVLAAGLPDMLPRAWGLERHAPDLWVALVLYMACRGRGYAAVGWGIVVGLLRDAHSLDPLGTHAFVLGLVGLLFAEGRSERGTIVGSTRALCVLLGVVAAGWIYMLRMLPLGGALSLGDALAVFPTALWTTLLSLPLFASTDRLQAFDDLLGRSRGLPA
jgi:rod shape-determining protein MreD